MNPTNPTPGNTTKSSNEIMVQNQIFYITPGHREETPAKIVTLASKIDEYVLKIGHSNTHVMSVVIQLLTLGKVRLDFRDYSERLELLNPAETMTRPQAATIFDNHMQALRRREEVSLVTQKVVIQPPRIDLPRR